MSGLKNEAYSERYYAPVPSWKIKFMRSFIPYQLYRFAVINIKILRTVGIDK